MVSRSVVKLRVSEHARLFVRLEGAWKGNVPLSDDSEVVLNPLVVDVVARLERAHLDLGISNPGSSRGKASPLVREGGADDI